MTTTTSPVVVLEAHCCKTQVTYNVTFSGTDADALAAAFINSHSSTHAFAVTDDFDDQAAPLTADAIWPTCEHGLSARLCGGPMHWYDRD